MTSFRTEKIGKCLRRQRASLFDVNVRDQPVFSHPFAFKVSEEPPSQDHHAQERADAVVVGAVLNELPLPAAAGKLVHLQRALVVDEPVVREGEKHLVEGDAFERVFGIGDHLVVGEDEVLTPYGDFSRVNAVDEAAELVHIDAPKREGVAVVEVVDEGGRVVLLAWAPV